MCASVGVVVILMVVCGDSMGEVVGDWGIWVLLWSVGLFSKVCGDFRAGGLGKRMR